MSTASNAGVWSLPSSSFSQKHMQGDVSGGGASKAGKAQAEYPHQGRPSKVARKELIESFDRGPEDFGAEHCAVVDPWDWACLSPKCVERRKISGMTAPLPGEPDFQPREKRPPMRQPLPPAQRT